MSGGRLPRHSLHALWIAASASLLIGFLGLPLLALLGWSPGGSLLAGLSHPLVLPALRLSFVTTTASLFVVVVLGIPTAWWLAHARGPWAKAASLLVALPVVLPPAVAGLALLLAFGRHGLLGEPLGLLGVRLPFSTAAVVLAEVFVSAPFFVQAAVAAFRRLDPDVVAVARTLGAGPGTVLLRVAVPACAAGLLAGAAMSWARALGEFGATLMFAGNFSGRTQTMPLAIYGAMESDLGAARSLSVVMLAFAMLVLWLARAGVIRPERSGTEGLR